MIITNILEKITFDFWNEKNKQKKLRQVKKGAF